MSLAEVGRFVFSISGLVTAVAVAAIWLAVRPSSRAGRRFLALVAIAYGLGSIYVVPYVAGRFLVLGYHELTLQDMPRGRIAIAVLNADNEFVENWGGRRLPYIDRASAARLWEAYRVYHLAADAWVICSEGQPRVSVRAEPSGAAKRSALVHLDIPESRILFDSGAVTTHEEAVRMAPIIRSVKADRVILVTSDTHMRRSLASFRHEGIDAVPAIARDPQRAERWSAWLIPSVRGLNETAEVAHEMIGIIVYAARGWLRF